MEETNIEKENTKGRRRCKVFVNFLIHLLFVVAILVAGSFVFIEIEEKGNDGKSQNRTFEIEEEFFQKLNSKYKIIISDNQRVTFMEEFNSYLKNQRLASQQNKEKSSNHELFLKWFHFSNIAATTIGKFCSLKELEALKSS